MQTGVGSRERTILSFVNTEKQHSFVLEIPAEIQKPDYNDDGEFLV